MCKACWGEAGGDGDGGGEVGKRERGCRSPALRREGGDLGQDEEDAREGSGAEKMVEEAEQGGRGTQEEACTRRGRTECLRLTDVDRGEKAGLRERCGRAG